MKPLKSIKCFSKRFLKNRKNDFENNKFNRFLFLLMGFASLIWVLLRIIPKPSRTEYPCMKVAAPIAGGFLTYIIGVLISLFSFKKIIHYFKHSKYTLAAIFTVIVLSAGIFTIINTGTNSFASVTSPDSLFVPTDLPNKPIGIAKGIYPGRVVWMWDSAAATWDGRTGYWWDDNSTHQENVDSMLSKSLQALTGKSFDSDAWDALFKNFNQNRGKGSIGYQPGEKIAVKINLNLISTPASAGYINNPGNTSFTSPQVVLAVLRQLVQKVGVKAGDITFYDAIRYVPDPIYNKCKSEFPDVHFMGFSAMNGREKYVRDTTYIHWAEKLTLEINGGHKAYLPTVVTKAEYLINLASFKAHRYVGVSFCTKNHFGTISSDWIDGTPYVYAPHAAGLHPYVAVHDIIIPGSAEWTFTGRPMGTYNALVDLMGHKDLGGKTLLFMIDALYGVQSEQDAVSLNSRWLSSPFNNRWTSSLFLSQDNLAIESVGLDLFRTEQSINKNIIYVYGAVDNYLHEAALANNPPSGTKYDPEGDGSILQSLGVHEHWNNAIDKKYTRNLGTGEGIELFRLPNITTSVQEERIPSEFVLFPNYPNPFNPSTTISYQIATRSFVSIAIFDATGNEIVKLVNEEKQAGKYQVQFNASNISSGVYFYRLRAKQISGDHSFIDTKKLVLLK